jgi:CheY-like chemotaxis protein
MEGLSTEEAAWVLGLHEEEARRRFEAAEAAVARQLATDVLIIEDEPLIAAHLERLVAEMGHAVSGLAATRAEAVALAGAAPPGLVLADIRLADGSDGIETADEIRRRRDVPVIFITAYPERLLTGRRREPAFVLAKPFAEAAVKALIGQALFFHQPRPVLRVV